MVIFAGFFGGFFTSFYVGLVVGFFVREWGFWFFLEGWGVSAEEVGVGGFEGVCSLEER